jgi:CheY-like chemotaxis protein
MDEPGWDIAESIGRWTAVRDFKGANMKPASILIADDESNIRLTIGEALKSEGYQVWEAANGKEALAAIEKHPPDLLVLDLNMPVMDGMAVLEHLKSQVGRNKPRVIMLTAYGSIAAAVRATRLGALDFLEKPITPSELRRMVRSIFNEPELDAPTIGTIAAPVEYEKALAHIRKALRLADLSNAESLLEKAAEQRNQYTAEYFNLLGVLYEAQHKWRLARKCYDKAIAADAHFEPPQVNMRRLYELQARGRTTHPVNLGDETDEVWFARLPEVRT